MAWEGLLPPEELRMLQFVQIRGRSIGVAEGQGPLWPRRKPSLPTPPVLLLKSLHLVKQKYFLSVDLVTVYSTK